MLRGNVFARTGAPIVPVDTFPSLDGGEGDGHPLFRGKLRPMDKIKYPVFGTVKTGIIKDEWENPYRLGRSGYQWLNMFLDPDKPPTGRNDPVWRAWYDARNKLARDEFAGINDLIYKTNGWNNGPFVYGQFADTEALEKWARENHTTRATLEAEGVTARIVRQPNPNLDRATPRFYPETVPFLLLPGSQLGPNSYTSQDYEGLAQHDPEDDGRDLIAGVRAPMPPSVVEILRGIYSNSALGVTTNTLRTVDGLPPAFLLVINRWSRFAYLQGTNIATMPGKYVVDFEKVGALKLTSDIGAFLGNMGELEGIGDKIKALLDGAGGLIESQIDKATKESAPKQPPAAGGSPLLLVLLALAFGVAL